ncbi:unnamed protein product [Rotaria sp. Silwood2]|nr:unnamed protein product [Rotaria sp. Silwood2]
MSFAVLNRNLRKYDDRTLSELLRSGLPDAADVEIDTEECACESEFIRPVRAAYTAMIDFLRQHNLGDQGSYNSLVDTFTTAGLYDQLVQSADVLVLQEEIDTTLNNMGFYVTGENDSRQLLCPLWEGLDDNKKTKSSRQNICQSNLTLCGASTGKSFTPLIRECLDDLPTRLMRDLLKPRDLRKPTIAQILLCDIVAAVLTRINVSPSEETDHGLSLALYNEVQTIIRERVPYIITVTKNIVGRAIYLHGFLYEQSERLLHLNTHRNNNIPQIKLIGEQLQKHLMREILMMRNFIIMANAIYSIPVSEHILLMDYYVLMSTNRPIFCYIIVVLKVNDLVDREILIEKLQQHNVFLEEYMILNNSFTLPKSGRLNQSALNILSMPSYVAVYGGPYDQQLSFERPSIVLNSHQNDSYSSNISTTQPQRSPPLYNRQCLQKTSVSNKCKKRSISPVFVESDSSISNSERTNGILNRNIERNTIRSTFSITSISFQEIRAPVSRTTYNRDAEGIVIMGRGIVTTTSSNTGANIRRRLIKINDETSAINVTI